MEIERNLENKKLVEDYFLHKKQGKGISEKTVYAQSNILKTLSEFVNKTFKEVTEKDIRNYLNQYENSNTTDTKKAVIRKFYIWLYKVRRNQPLPQCISWIEFSSRATKERNRNLDKDKERIVTKEQYYKLLDACNRTQYKAVLETLWTFGCRVGELVSPNIGDVKQNGDLIEITFRVSKTKKRTVYSKESLGYLINWVNYRKAEGAKNDDPLFTSVNPNPRFAGNRMCVNAIQKLLVRLMNFAELDRKRLSPHDFRHTAITRALGEGMPKTHVETFFGLVKNTKVFSIYDHNGEDELRNYINGSKPEIKRPETYEELKRKKDTLEKDLTNKINGLTKLVNLMVERAGINLGDEGLSHVLKDMKRNPEVYLSDEELKAEE